MSLIIISLIFVSWLFRICQADSYSSDKSDRNWCLIRKKFRVDSSNYYIWFIIASIYWIISFMIWAEFFFQHMKFLIMIVNILWVILIYLILKYNQILSAYLSSQVLIILISSSNISSEIIIFILKFFLFYSVLNILIIITLLRDVNLIFLLFLSDFWIA